MEKNKKKQVNSALPVCPWFDCRWRTWVLFELSLPLDVKSWKPSWLRKGYKLNKFSVDKQVRYKSIKMVIWEASFILFGFTVQVKDDCAGNASELCLLHLINCLDGGKLFSYLYYFSAHTQSFSYLKYLRLGSIMLWYAHRFSTKRGLPWTDDSLLVRVGQVVDFARE